MNSTTLSKATELWEYLSACRETAAADAVVVCCSYDLRVCDHACELIKAGLSDKLVLSGDSGHWTRHLWDKPEAHVFYQRALSNGLAADTILLEDRAGNFGENITFARALLPSVRTVTFVSKPNSLLRVKLTAAAQWPEIESRVSCPSLVFPQDVSNIIGVLGVIDEMVGDIERIIKYPDRGFQVPHALPQNIMATWHYLIDQGFTRHLMPEGRSPG